MTDVFVVSPVRVHRETLSAALDEVAALELVGQAATLDEALPKLRGRQRPSVALLDGPPLGDLVIAAPLPNDPEPKLVAMGVPEYEAVAWLEAGAAGVVPPDGSLEEVVVAVERVAGVAAEAPNSIPEGLLTSRETEILNLLNEGLSNKQIAQRLTIEIQTVKNHVHNVFVKLGVHGRAEAAARVRRGGGAGAAH